MGIGYWEFWSEWSALHTKIGHEVVAACRAFVRQNPKWLFVAHRWDNPDWLLSGPLRDGFWGNIHILLLNEERKLRFTYALWRDVDEPSQEPGYRTFKRYWATSDDDAGDRTLDWGSVSEAAVHDLISNSGDGLSLLCGRAKGREKIIKLPLPIHVDATVSVLSKLKGKSSSTGKIKRMISEAGRKRIAAAQRARWAKMKAKQKKAE